MNDTAPAVSIDMAPWCGCAQGNDSWARLSSKFVRPSKEFVDAAGFDTAAAIDLADWPDFSTYRKALRKAYKGNALRDAAKADREGFVCHPFSWRLHVPDAHEVNTSKAARCGRPMADNYLVCIDKMGGYPNDRTPRRHTPEPCKLHNYIPWGIFAPTKPYFQGMVQTDEKMIGYIKFKRIGDVALYTQILGHGDYLRLGIMYRLHLAVMEWIMGPEREYFESTDGIRYVIYGAWNTAKGVMLWKKKMLFRPVRLYQRRPE